MPDPQPLSDDERDELIAYLDGEADADTARNVEAKMNRDPRVRNEAEALRKTYDLLDYLPKPEPSPSFTHKTLTRASLAIPGLVAPTRPPWQRWALGIAWVAAVLIVGVAAYAAAPLVYQAPATGDSAAEREQQLVRDLRVIDNLRPLNAAGDINFLHELDRPELFGDDHAGF